MMWTVFIRIDNSPRTHEYFRRQIDSYNNKNKMISTFTSTYRNEVGDPSTKRTHVVHHGSGERERERAGKVKHQHTTDTHRYGIHITKTKTPALRYIEKAAQNKCAP